MNLSIEGINIYFQSYRDLYYFRIGGMILQQQNNCANRNIFFYNVQPRLADNDSGTVCFVYLCGPFHPFCCL